MPDPFGDGNGAERGDQPEQLEDDEGHHPRVHERGGHAQGLHAELGGIAREKTVGAALHAFWANTPVRSAPVMPPIPWPAKTSSESSSRVRER